MEPECFCDACKALDAALRLHTDAIARGLGYINRQRVADAAWEVDLAHGLAGIEEWGCSEGRRTYYHGMAAKLAERRKVVAELRAAGITIGEIAKRVGVSPTTVESDLERSGIRVAGPPKPPKEPSPPPENKVCRHCRQRLPLEEFPHDLRNRDGCVANCRVCLRAMARAAYQARRWP